MIERALQCVLQCPLTNIGNTTMKTVTPVIIKKTHTKFGPNAEESMVTKEMYSFPVLPDVQPLSAILFVLKQRALISPQAENMEAHLYYNASKDTHSINVTFTTCEGRTTHTIQIFDPATV